MHSVRLKFVYYTSFYYIWLLIHSKGNVILLPHIEVDYKVLMSCEGDSLLQLLPSLSSSNIHMVADIARHIPYGQGAMLTSGMVLCGFALKLFWTGQKATSKSSAVSFKEP